MYTIHDDIARELSEEETIFFFHVPYFADEVVSPYPWHLPPLLTMQDMRNASGRRPAYYNYVITISGTLRIASFLYRHHQIAGGRPVQAAGEIIMKDKEILQANTISGHYVPCGHHLKNLIAATFERYAIDRPREFVIDACEIPPLLSNFNIATIIHGIGNNDTFIQQAICIAREFLAQSVENLKTNYENIMLWGSTLMKNMPNFSALLMPSTHATEIFQFSSTNTSYQTKVAETSALEEMLYDAPYQQQSIEEAQVERQKSSVATSSLTLFNSMQLRSNTQSTDIAVLEEVQQSTSHALTELFSQHGSIMDKLRGNCARTEAALAAFDRSMDLSVSAPSASGVAQSRETQLALRETAEILERISNRSQQISSHTPSSAPLSSPSYCTPQSSGYYRHESSMERFGLGSAFGISCLGDRPAPPSRDRFGEIFFDREKGDKRARVAPNLFSSSRGGVRR